MTNDKIIFVHGYSIHENISHRLGCTSSLYGTLKAPILSLLVLSKKNDCGNLQVRSSSSQLLRHDALWTAENLVVEVCTRASAFHMCVLATNLMTVQQLLSYVPSVASLPCYILLLCILVHRNRSSSIILLRVPNGIHLASAEHHPNDTLTLTIQKCKKCVNYSVNVF